MKKLLFLQAAMAFVLFSCELDLGTLGDGEWTNLTKKDISVELVLTPAPEYGYWKYKSKVDTTYYIMIPKYYKVDGTHSLFDKVDPKRSFAKIDTGRITFSYWTTFVNPCTLKLFNTKDNSSLSWYGSLDEKSLFLSNFTCYLSEASGTGKFEKVTSGSLYLTSPFKSTSMTLMNNGYLWFYR